MSLSPTRGSSCIIVTQIVILPYSLFPPVDSPYLVKRLEKTRVLEGHTGCVSPYMCAMHRYYILRKYLQCSGITSVPVLSVHSSVSLFQVNSVSWNDTGTRLISGSDDCHLNIYDTATGLVSQYP